MRLACIFACESAWADHGLPFEQSVVGSLISRTWLAFVIGAQTGIDRFAAQEFLDAALDALEQGVSLDLALACGRRAIRGIDHRESSRKHSRLDWWIPVLYSTTDNFEILPEESRDILPHTWTKEGTLPKEMSPLPRSPSGLRALWQAFLRTLTGPISPERESVREMLARKEKL